MKNLYTKISLPAVLHCSIPIPFLFCSILLCRFSAVVAVHTPSLPYHFFCYYNLLRESAEAVNTTSTILFNLWGAFIRWPFTLSGINPWMPLCVCVCVYPSTKRGCREWQDCNLPLWKIFTYGLQMLHNKVSNFEAFSESSMKISAVVYITK